MIKRLEDLLLIGIFLDTETNGLNFKRHEAIEIAIELINLESGAVLESYNSLIQISPESFSQSDPESLAYTGITYEELKGGKSPQKIKDDVLDLFKRHNLVRRKSVFICQNPSFDRIFFTKIVSTITQEELSFPYNWLDLASMHWALEMRKGTRINKIQLSKDQIANGFSLPPEKKPHRARNGTLHLIECYAKVVGFTKVLQE